MGASPLEKYVGLSKVQPWKVEAGASFVSIAELGCTRWSDGFMVRSRAAIQIYVICNSISIKYSTDFLC